MIICYITTWDAIREDPALMAKFNELSQKRIKTKGSPAKVVGLSINLD